MATQTTTFSAVGAGEVFGVNHGDAIYYSITPGVTLDATFKLQRTRDLGTWETVVTTSDAVGDTIFYAEHPGLSSMLYRWICTAFGETSDPVDTLIYDANGIVMASFVAGNVTFAEDGTIITAGSIVAAGSVSTQDLSVGDDAAITGDLQVYGATTLSGTFTVGVNGTGKDVKFFGDTSGKSWLWDESADKMIVAGNADIGTATSDLIGFHGATAVDQGAALTAQLTTITHTAAGSADYAIDTLVQNTGFGFVTADEGHSVLAVIANLQARLAEVEQRLEEKGLIAAN